MTIKALSFDEMKTKLGDMVEGRPHLANCILSGHSSFSVKGETYALRGSPALSREFDLVTRDVEPGLGVVEKRSPAKTPPASGHRSLDELFREVHADTAAEERSAPTEARPVLTPAAEPAPTKAGHAKVGARLDGEPTGLPAVQTRDSRIATQRAVQAARTHVFELTAASATKAQPSARLEAHRTDERVRRIGRIESKAPASIASRLEPKGAA